MKPCFASLSKNGRTVPSFGSRVSSAQSQSHLITEHEKTRPILEDEVMLVPGVHPEDAVDFFIGVGGARERGALSVQFWKL